MLISVVLLVLLIFSIRDSVLNKSIAQENEKSLNDYKEGNQRLEKKINSLGQEINSQKVILGNSNSLLQKEIEENSELKKVISHYQVTSKTNISPFIVKYDTIEINNTDTILQYVPVGSKFHKNDKWYSVAGVVGIEGIEFKKFEVINKYDFNTGYKYKGLQSLIRKNEITVELINKNPYTSTLDMKSITFKEKKKWYQTRGCAIIVGAIGGIVTYKFLTK